VQPVAENDDVTNSTLKTDIGRIYKYVLSNDSVRGRCGWLISCATVAEIDDDDDHHHHHHHHPQPPAYMSDDVPIIIMIMSHMCPHMSHMCPHMSHMCPNMSDDVPIIIMIMIV